MAVKQLSLSSSSSLESEPPQETRLIKAVNFVFRRWAHIIAKHTVLAIIMCCLLSILGTYKILNTPNENDIMAYSPYGARSRDEFAIYQDFFARDGASVYALVLIVPKDNKTMLRMKQLNASVEVVDIISNRFPIYNRHLHVNQSFAEFCSGFCSFNEPVRQFYNGFTIQSELRKQGFPLNDRIDLSYPITRLYGREISLQPNFFGLTMFRDSETKTGFSAVGENNSSTSTRLTNMKSVKMLSLLYRAERLAAWSDEDVKGWEMRLTNFFAKEYKSDAIRVMVISHTLVEHEIVRAGFIVLPFLSLGFLVMICCSVVTTMLSALYMRQLSVGKFILAIAAGVCPFMATATALGGLFVCGMRFGSILCVTPLLVLAIGVDNAYLMVHAWQRVTKRLRDWPVKDDSPAFRLAEVLHETGPAILISMLTNVFADAVGAVTSSPDITLLCVGNLVSLVINFAFQMTFYASIMLIVGRFEINDEQRRLKRIVIAAIECDKERYEKETTEEGGVFYKRVNKVFSTFVDEFSKQLTKSQCAIAVTIAWIAYIVFSVWGITRMEILLKPAKLVPCDSIFIEMNELREKYVIPHFTHVTFFVNNPGNLSDPHRMELLNKMVTDLEQRSDSWGPVATKYFMRDFRKYQQSYAEQSESADVEIEEGEQKHDLAEHNNDAAMFNVKDLEMFVEWPEYAYWKAFIRVETNKTSGQKILKKFFFITAYHGDNLKDWNKRGALVRDCRRIIDAYAPIFNVSLFTDDSVYFDLIDNIPTDTWQSIATTLIFMGLICFVFMYDTFTVFVSMATIASVCIGILGQLSWMGVNLDPMVMAATLISIGFSIDVPAHVAYHFHNSGFEGGSNLGLAHRLKTTLSSVGFPVIQASLSTNLCLLTLMLVPLHMAQVFAKTMVLCVSLCLLHGVIVIPALLSLGTNVSCHIRQMWRRRRATTATVISIMPS